uniref:Uncharacterized protein n=1 Tax=Avena sativa TaxID=4498 RepID=A0ACD5WD74_AVESA
MGSLMAGWDSPVLGDDTKARRMRTRSLTKEEVEAFWRQQGKPVPVPEGGGGEAVVDVVSPRQTTEKSPLGSSKQTSISPVAHGHDEICTDDAAAAGESPGKSRDWWTRSNWAFLNEPPQEEAPGTAHTYTPQFHVAAGNA